MNSREIKELARRYNLSISPRRMGQNFLVDPRQLERIAHTVGATAGDKVLEIGAGLGALTEQLLATGATLYAVEKDAKFTKVLGERFPDSKNLQVIHSDILELDLAAYAQAEPKSLIVVGNLPFSMTSPILEFLLKQRQWVKRAVFTIQKEVAQRIVAKPGTKAYSSLTMLTHVAFEPSLVFTIPPNCFYPQPKVTSAVIQLDAIPEPIVPPDEEEGVLKLVRLIFTHRRKTLLNALSIPGVGLSREEIVKRLLEISIDPVRRPETFNLKEMLQLSRALRLR